ATTATTPESVTTHTGRAARSADAVRPADPAGRVSVAAGSSAIHGHGVRRAAHARRRRKRAHAVHAFAGRDPACRCGGADPRLLRGVHRKRDDRAHPWLRSARNVSGTASLWSRTCKVSPCPLTNGRRTVSVDRPAVRGTPDTDAGHARPAA